MIFITGVVQTDKQLIPSDVDTSEKHKVANISATLSINLDGPQCDTHEPWETDL